VKPPDLPILVFDGVCNLCAGAVRFVWRNERGRVVRFAAVQSPAGKRLMREYGLDPEEPRTLLFIVAGRGHTRSDAVMELARYLRFPWGMLRFARWVPRRMRNWLYELIARHRYRWFGRRDACFVPAGDERDRFLPDPASEAD